MSWHKSNSKRVVEENVPTSLGPKFKLPQLVTCIFEKPPALCSHSACVLNNRSIIETVTRYPSGLTEAVILAELELLW